MHDRILYRLTWLAAAMSLGHQLDHLIRGNAAGWPLAIEVNAFTASLVVDPVIATGLLAYRAGRWGQASGPWSPAAPRLTDAREASAPQAEHQHADAR